MDRVWDMRIDWRPPPQNKSCLAWKYAYERTLAVVSKFLIFLKGDMIFSLTTQPRSSTSWMGARWPSCATQFRTIMSNLFSSSWTNQR